MNLDKFNFVNEHIHNLYSRDGQFKAARDYLRMPPIEQQFLTDSDQDEIKDSIREGLEYYDILNYMGVRPENRGWFTELLVELLTNKVTGKPVFEKPVLTIRFASDGDYEKFENNFVGRRPDRNAPASENYEVDIAGIKAIDWTIEECSAWFDEGQYKVISVEPEEPVMTFKSSDDGITFIQRYPNGPVIDIERLKQDLDRVGIHYVIDSL